MYNIYTKYVDDHDDDDDDDDDAHRSRYYQTMHV